MAATISRKKRLPAAKPEARLVLGPDSAGIILTPAEFEDGWRYELIYGVLLVTPVPLESEADPNEELGHLLRSYRENHPEGKALDKTLPDRYVKTGDNRRKPDRMIWA